MAFFPFSFLCYLDLALWHAITFGGFLPELRFKSSLYDSKEVLVLCAFVSSDAAIQPAYAPLHGLLHSLPCGQHMDDIIQLHDDVSANGVLYSDGLLRSEKHFAAVVRRLEFHPFLHS